MGVLAALLALVLAVGTVAWMRTCGFAGCPSTAELKAFRPSEGSRILDRNGVLLGRLTHVRRLNVPLARVPRYVRAAFIAVEDRRFYYHRGVDWRSAGRALWRNLTAFDVREGFSTISMQVVRSAFLPHLANERSLRRKLIELELARRLEQALSKQQILELYLNVIYLGNGTYGVEAASRDLFGKSVERLTLAEAATLAALARGPALYAPRRHPERAFARRNLVLGLMAREGFVSPESAERARGAGLARRNLVLGLMAREGFVSAESAERARGAGLALSASEWRPRRETSFELDPVRELVDSVLGEEASGLGDLVVHTTLDAAAQRAAVRAVADRAAAIERAAGARYRHAGEALEGALVALDPRDGEIRALVGARRLVRRGFNRALDARRQPGSAFKPFVYAAALEDGISPATVLDDTPVAVTDGERVWRPVNFGGQYAGPLTLRRALMRSANAATVRLSQRIGARRVVSLARRAGISSPLDPVPATALGALEVTPLELTAAYASFGNGGLRVTPRLVRRIETPDGAVLWRSPVVKPERVLGAAEAYQLTSMLESVVDGGTGSVVRELGVSGPVAGKTGTTNNGADIWFVGYTPSIVATVWFGYDTPRPIAANASGGRLAAPAWAAFYRNGWRERSGHEDWTPPAGLVRRTIDAFNGDLANEWCPTTQREWFKSGTEPTRPCTEHKAPLEERIERFAKKVGAALKELLGF